MTKTLEDYIKDIVNKSLLNFQNEAVSKTAEMKYSDAVKKISENAQKSHSGYGTRAESISENGLFASGYKDYIDTRVKNKTKNSLDIAADSKDGQERAEIFGYEEHLKEAEASVSKLKNEVLSYAERNDISDFDKLYEYALNKGLTDEDAKSVAESATENVKSALRIKNMEKARNTIIIRKFTKAQAYEYAIGLGLSHDDADSLADFAYKMNQDPASIVMGGGGTKGGIENSSAPHTEKHPNKFTTVFQK